MERKKIITEKNIIALNYILFCVGIPGHIFLVTREFMLSLTPLILFFITSMIILYIAKHENTKILYWILFVYSATLLIEIIGVKTGLLFGNYSYGESLGIKLLNVPLVIGINWIFIILGSIIIASRIIQKIIPAALISALLSTIFDIILEPVAIKLDYWVWKDGIIPLQNYIVWFFVALFSALLFFKLNIRVKSKLPVHYFIIQVLFFASLNIWL